MIDLDAKLQQLWNEIPLKIRPFLDLWLNRSTNGLSGAGCALKSNPSITPHHAKYYAHAWLQDHSVIMFLGAYGVKSLDIINESADTRVKYWREQSKTGFENLRPYCDIRIKEDPTLGQTECLWVADPAQIPDNLKCYVTRYVPFELGYQVQCKDLNGPKERNVAAQQLDKMLGMSIERIELSGILGTVQAALPEGAGLDQIAELYQGLIAGKK